MAEIDQFGVRLDLGVRQGSTLGPYDDTLHAGGDDVTPGPPFDLTGCTIRGSVRKTIKDADVVANLVITYNPDRTTGNYKFSIPASVTVNIPAGAKPTDSASTYVWDSELMLPDGRVIPLYYGNLRLQAEVTRDPPP